MLDGRVGYAPGAFFESTRRGEDIGAGARFAVADAMETARGRRRRRAGAAGTHALALQHILNWLDSTLPNVEFQAVGHRVVLAATIMHNRACRCGGCWPTCMR